MHAVVYGTRIARPARASESLGSSVKTDANGLIAPIRGEPHRKRYITVRSPIPRSDNTAIASSVRLFLSVNDTFHGYAASASLPIVSRSTFDRAHHAIQRNRFLPFHGVHGVDRAFRISRFVSDRRLYTNCRILSIRLIRRRKMTVDTKAKGA